MRAAAVAEDCYFDLPALARYSGMSVRTLRRYLVDAENPIPHHYVRAGGKDRGRVLIYKRDFDAWVQRFPPTVPVPAAKTTRSTALETDAAAILRRIRR